MGFDIFAYAIDKRRNNRDDLKEVAYHRAYMGGFRMMREQGYDWFMLIDALECDAGVSGNGTGKIIKLIDLKVALRILKNFEVERMSSEDRDEITDRSPELIDFMKKCIRWCEKNKKEGILIYFG